MKKKQNTQNTTEKNIWLDVELREDIDDFLTLIYALEQNTPVNVVSIHNPSEKELRLLGVTLKRFDSKAVLVVAGEKTDYPPEKDIHTSLYNRIQGVGAPNTVTLATFLSESPLPGQRFFCGGSLHTLAHVLANDKSVRWHAYIQGGYAGANVVGDHNVLKKFRGREAVPTWNLNLDLTASIAVLSASNVQCYFISKNVCHNAWVDQRDVNDFPSEFNRVLVDYFAKNRWPNKCMHDLVAFMAMYSDDLIEFAPVTLQHSEDERAKWSSSLCPGSEQSISIALDTVQFSRLIRLYQPKKSLPNAARPRLDLCEQIDTVLQQAELSLEQKVRGIEILLSPYGVKAVTKDQLSPLDPVALTQLSFPPVGDTPVEQTLPQKVYGSPVKASRNRLR
jgi:hypothetical protein